MLKKVLLIAGGVLLVGAAGLFLAVRSILGPDSVRVAIEHQATDALGQLVKVGSATVSLFPRIGVDLGAVTVGHPAAISLQRVSVTTGLRGLLSRRVENATIVVADSRLTLPLPFRIGAEAGGAPARTSAQAASAGAPALAIVSIETIALRNLTLAVGDKALTVDLDSSLEGDRLDIDKVSAKSDMTKVEARGVLASLARRQGTLDIEGDPLDLDELMAILSGIAASGATTSPGRHGASTDGGRASNAIDLRVNLAAPRGRAAGYDFVDLMATLEISPTAVSLAPLAFGVFGGRFDGTAGVDLAGGSQTMSIGGSIAGVDMATIVAAAGSPGVMTGTLGGDVSLGGRGADTASVLKTARGSARLAIADGTIAGLEMVRTVVLAFGKPTGAPPPGSGSSFSRLGGTFALADGVLTSRDIALASRDFDMAARGTVSLANGALDVEADVVLSDELSAQAGSDLVKYAQEEGRVVLPARITGTVAQPSVFIDIGKAMGRAVKNELTRGAKSLLQGLVKKP